MTNRQCPPGKKLKTGTHKTGKSAGKRYRHCVEDTCSKPCAPAKDGFPRKRGRNCRCAKTIAGSRRQDVSKWTNAEKQSFLARAYKSFGVKPNSRARPAIMGGIHDMETGPHCPGRKILNPSTRRCVNPDGRAGRAIMGASVNQYGRAFY